MRLGKASAVALALFAALAGCATPQSPTNEGVDARGAAVALDHVTLANGSVVERASSAVTLRWEDELQQTTISPTEERVFLGEFASTTLSLPIAAFFSIELSISSAQEPLSVFLDDARGETRCVIGEARLATCVPFARIDEAENATWTLLVAAEETSQPPIPFTVDARVQLVAPAADGLPAIPLHDEFRFTPPVGVAPDIGMHEPSLDVTPGGTIYVTGYTSLPGALWRSTDDGATFERVAVTDVAYCNNEVDSRVPVARALSPPGTFHWGCGDIDVAVSGDDTIYFAHHWNGEAVHASHDGGATWTSQLAAGNEMARTDRAWLVADGQNAWLAFNSARRATGDDIVGDTVVSRTIDGGLTWLQVGQITQSNCIPGGFARSPTDGRLYLGACGDEGPTVAVSADDGVTWSWHVIAPRSGDAGNRICYTCGIYTVVDVDDAGNVHATWADPSDGDRFRIWYATSRDGGATWSDAIQVSTATGTHVMPWLAAGREGHAVVVWYATALETQPHEATNAVWYAHAAETLDGLAPIPVFRETLVSETPVQYGPICLEGSACETGRNLGDYFQVALDAEDRPLVAYADGRGGGTWTGGSRVLFTRVA